MHKGHCPFGTHRVIEPLKTLPQAAQSVDPSLPIHPNEILINVDTLNIDSASFHQMMEASGGNPGKVGELILQTVAQRGKQHNPVTGSGGMLLGTVQEIGPDHPNPWNIQIGDRIATLVSLSLTPLIIEKIVKIHANRDQVEIKGHAILFATGNLAKIPDDMPENLALAVLDVAGAPARMLRLVKPGMRVMIIGAGGKSGLLCCAAARNILGGTGQLIGLEPGRNGQDRLHRLGLCDSVLSLDATDPVSVHHAILEITEGNLCDLVVNCANVNNTEMSSVMSAHNSGTVYLFSMATSFTKAALGAEGVSSDATMIIGNGFAPDSARISLDVLRGNQALWEMFASIYV